MLKLIIEVEAKTQDGLETSVEEALRIIKRGNRGGGDSNDDKSYDFNITGEEEPIKAKIVKKGKKFDIVTEYGYEELGFKTKNEAMEYAKDQDLEIVQEF